MLIETDGGAEHIRYDAAGRIAEKLYPQTGRKKVYTYYENGLLKSLLTYREGELIGAESMEYDKNGNKTLWEQNGSITKYAYDGMNRLQSVTDAAGVRTEYEFDGFGNIAKEYTLLPYGINSRGYEYDAANRLLLSYDESSATRYSYDAAGNLTEKIYELAGRETKSHYGYDGYNRLVSFVSGNTTAEYAYNPEGLRESKTVNGSPTRFLYDGADIVGELTADNYYLYYRGTELLASKAFSGKAALYELDSHGSVTALLDYEGIEQKTYAYNAYGKEQIFIAPAGSQSVLYQWKQETENGHNPFRYCGEYFDEETGLIYLRNRYYDPSARRFTQEDPARDELNWYAYCGNNPVNYMDPWGLWAAPYTDENGVYHGDPDYEKYHGTITYQALSDLTESYELAQTVALKQRIANLALEVRNITDRVGVESMNYYDLVPDWLVDYSVNDVEKVLFLGNKNYGVTSLVEGSVAAQKTKEFFGSAWEVGTESDAFRHAFWSAILTNKTTIGFAKFWMDAHEFGTPENLGTQERTLQTHMDLSNNAKGMEIGSSTNYDSIERLVRNAQFAGKLLKIVNGNLVSTNGDLKISSR